MEVRRSYVFVWGGRVACPLCHGTIDVLYKHAGGLQNATEEISSCWTDINKQDTATSADNTGTRRTLVA